MEIIPTGGALGAEIRGVDVTKPLAPEEVAVLEVLLRHVTRPELVWTHKWRPGDLVVGDNRCTMHRREPFAATERRILKRTQMFGDAPFLEL